MSRCLERLGALPKTLVFDREGAIHAGGGHPSEGFPEGAGGGARSPELCGDEEAAARLAVADRDLAPRLEEVELAELAGSVDGPLVGALGAQDPAAARAGSRRGSSSSPGSRRFDQLADAGVVIPSTFAQQAGDLAAVRVEL